MEFVLKIGGLISLLAISYQDFKERKVSVYLFVLALVCVSSLYYIQTTSNDFFINAALNLVILLLIVIILFGYSWFKLKRPLFEVFGLGDVLFFLVLGAGFPLVTFVVLFVSSLIFTLILFLLLKPKLIDKTVPLAGTQALFLTLLFGLNWMFHLVNLYQ